jgi:hypothetical protein
MIARLSCDALGDRALSAPQRLKRASAARAWLASLAVPAKARQVLARALDATAGDADAIPTALGELVNVAGQWLDEASVAELRGVTAAPLVSSR